MFAKSVVADLYDHCLLCRQSSHGAEAHVADSSEEYGYGGELRTGDPGFVCYREGENAEEDGEDEIEVLF